MGRWTLSTSSTICHGLAILAVAALADGAQAEPYRLRADVYSSAEPGAGVIMLQGHDDERPWLDAEAVVWGAVDEDEPGDALVMTVRVRDPKGRGELRVGRFLLATGAVRPVHLDGFSAAGRDAKWGQLEIFGGVPVEPEFGAGVGDAFAGVRVSHTLERWGTGGLSMAYRRDNGFLSDQELGLDLTSPLSNWLDLYGRGSYDLLSPGISDARLSIAARKGHLRGDLTASRRSAGRILPATSLFTVLGDFASDELGANASWRAAPRLDVDAHAALRTVGEDLGGEASLRSLLRLNERGDKVVALEVRRQSAPVTGWTGVRATGRAALPARFVASTELELVIPDESNGRGSVWPWALVAVGYMPMSGWEAAFATEVGASPSHTSEVNVLFRLSSRWEASP